MTERWRNIAEYIPGVGLFISAQKSHEQERIVKQYGVGASRKMVLGAAAITVGTVGVGLACGTIDLLERDTPNADALEKAKRRATETAQNGQETITQLGQNQPLLVNVSDNPVPEAASPVQDDDGPEPLRVCFTPDERRTFEFTTSDGRLVEFDVQRIGFTQRISIAGPNGEPVSDLPIKVEALGDKGDPCFNISLNE